MNKFGFLCMHAKKCGCLREYIDQEKTDPASWGPAFLKWKVMVFLFFDGLTFVFYDRFHLA